MILHKPEKKIKVLESDVLDGIQGTDLEDKTSSDETISGAITSAEGEVKISDGEESEEMVNEEKKIGLYSSEDTVGGRGVTAPSQPAQPELSALPPNIVATSLDVLAYIRQMICAY